MNRSKRWLPEDDEKLRELFTSGVSPMRMAIRLGRTRRAVEVRVASLKLRHQAAKAKDRALRLASAASK